jgi:hypothetical protein
MYLPRHIQRLIPLPFRRTRAILIAWEKQILRKLEVVQPKLTIKQTISKVFGRITKLTNQCNNPQNGSLTKTTFRFRFLSNKVFRVKCSYKMGCLYLIATRMLYSNTPSSISLAKIINNLKTELIRNLSIRFKPAKHQTLFHFKWPNNNPNRYHSRLCKPFNSKYLLIISTAKDLKASLAYHKTAKIKNNWIWGDKVRARK